MIVDAKLIENITNPKPLKPKLSIASPPMVVLSIAPMLIAAEFKLIMVPLLSGTCSSPRVAMVVIVVPAMAVPITAANIARLTGRGVLKYRSKLAPPRSVLSQVVVLTPSLVANVPLVTWPRATAMKLIDITKLAVSMLRFRLVRM